MSLIDSVTADLRSRLLAGELPPGAPLGEVGIAERYGVGRPTARAAIDNLVRERLLTRAAHQRARVVRLRADEAFDIYRTREVIEAGAVRHLAGLRLAPAAAVEANERIGALLEAPPRSIVDSDMAFHSALVDELGSARLGSMYRSLVSEVMLCMSQVQDAALLSNRLIHDEHRRLLESIEAGDVQGAVSLLARHLAGARDRLVVKLHESHD